MTNRLIPNRYGAAPEAPESPPSTAEQFAAWAGDRLLPDPFEPGPEAHDVPPALPEVEAADVFERLRPGTAARLAAEVEKAGNADRFGEWASTRFVPSDETPEARSLAAFLNRSR